MATPGVSGIGSPNLAGTSDTGCIVSNQTSSLSNERHPVAEVVVPRRGVTYGERLPGEPDSVPSCHGGDAATAPRVPTASNATGALAALFSRVSRNADRVIIPLNARANDAADDGPAFYCIHSIAGGAGTDFLDIAKLMSQVRFFGIQAPNKKIRDPQFGGSVHSVVDLYARAIINSQPRGPIMVGGWSAGVPIALEVAQNLRARGRDVDLLVAIDGKPENAPGGLPAWHPRYVLDAIVNFPGWVRYDLFAPDRSSSVLLRLGIQVRVVVRKVLARLTGATQVSGDDLNGVVDNFSRYPALQQAFMKRLYHALMTHQYNKYPGRVVVYEASVGRCCNLPQLGRVWRHLAPRSEIVRIRGTHLSILRAPNVNRLAEDLQKRITAIMPGVAESEARAHGHGDGSA